WNADFATSYIVQRADGTSGSFVPLATLAPRSPNRYVDVSGAPGIRYRYRVDALNCDGQATFGSELSSEVAVSDASFLFVRAGAVGGNGTRANPYPTLAQANAQVNPTRNRILVAAGTYDERLTITQPLAVFGGYDATFDRYDPTAYRVVVRGDASSGDAAHGSIEFRQWSHPIFWIQGGNVVLDGIK